MLITSPALLNAHHPITLSPHWTPLQQPCLFPIVKRLYKRPLFRDNHNFIKCEICFSLGKQMIYIHFYIKMNSCEWFLLLFSFTTLGNWFSYGGNTNEPDFLADSLALSLGYSAVKCWLVLVIQTLLAANSNRCPNEPCSIHTILLAWC